MLKGSALILSNYFIDDRKHEIFENGTGTGGAQSAGCAFALALSYCKVGLNLGQLARSERTLSEIGDLILSKDAELEVNDIHKIIGR